MSIINLTDALLGEDRLTILSIVDNVGYIKADGTVSMAIGYVPTLTLNVATKGYIDDIAVTKQSVNEKGQINGYCPLDTSALVPAVHLPNRVENIVAGSGIVVNAIDPLNPVVSAVPISAAGLLSRIYATGDTTVLASGTYYLSSATTGAVASVEQTVAVDDNAKAYFAQDYIGDAATADVTYYAGAYAGTLTVKTSDDTDQQRFTIEIYKADVDGVVIDSGFAGEAIGDLGVKPLAVLTTGIIDIPANVLVNTVINGTLTEQVTLLTTQRIRFHVSGEKIGTIGGIATLSFFGGYDRSSYIDIPVAVTTDSVINKSVVPGATASDAINSLSSDVTTIFTKTAIEARQKLTADIGIVENAFTGPTYAIYNNPIQDVDNNEVAYAYVTTNTIYKYTPIGSTTLPLITLQGTGTLPYSTTVAPPVFYKLDTPGTVYYLHGEFADPLLRLMKSVDGGAWTEVSNVDTTGWVTTVDRPYEDFDTTQPVVIGDMVYMHTKNPTANPANITTVNLTTGVITLSALTIPLFTSSTVGIPARMTHIGNKLVLLSSISVTSLYVNTYDLDTLATTQLQIPSILNVNAGRIFGVNYSSLNTKLYFIGSDRTDGSIISLFSLDPVTLNMAIISDISAYVASQREDGLQIQMGNYYYFQPEDTTTQIYKYSLLEIFSDFYVSKNISAIVDDNAKNSFASGNALVVTRENGAAVGEYNEGKSTSLFEVGMGTGDLALSNAFEVDDSGDAQLPNSVVSFPKSVTTRDYVLGAKTFTAPQRTSITSEDNAIDFTVNNNFALTATAANITVTSVVGCTGQSGLITITTAENITGWDTLFKFRGDVVPTGLTGVERFAYFVESETSIAIGWVQ